MSAFDDGGPAFPAICLDPYGSFAPGDGMTLRDYFAARAMQGMLGLEGAGNYADNARDAYEMADAMLKARKNQEPNK